mgnify:CR=1 FL=1
MSSVYNRIQASPSVLNVIVVYPFKVVGVRVASPPSVIIVIILICPLEPFASVNAIAPEVATVVTGVVILTAVADVIACGAESKANHVGKLLNKEDIEIFLLMGHLLHEVDPQQQYLFLSLLGQLFFYQPFVYPHFVNPLCIRGMLLHANTWIKCRGRNPPLRLFISYDTAVVTPLSI